MRVQVPETARAHQTRGLSERHAHHVRAEPNRRGNAQKTEKKRGLVRVLPTWLNGSECFSKLFHQQTGNGGVDQFYWQTTDGHPSGGTIDQD